MKSSTLSVFLFGCFSILTIVDHAAGYWARALPGVKCVANYDKDENGEFKSTCADGNCNFDDPNNVFKLACDMDCKAQHGAAGGYCLESDICNCGPPVFLDRKFTPMQCLDIRKAELYQTICEEDCKCTHNKIGGGCNFWTKMCECGPTNKAPTLDCPYKTSNEYFQMLLKRYMGEGIDVKKLLGAY